MNDTTSTITDDLAEAAARAWTACPKCASVEAWHPCVTEDDSIKYGCDGCGHWTSVQVRPSHPCPEWCTSDHTTDEWGARPDLEDVFEHLGDDLAQIPPNPEWSGEPVSVQPSLNFDRTGATVARRVAVRCERDLDLDEARQFAQAVLRTVELFEESAS